MKNLHLGIRLSRVTSETRFILFGGLRTFYGLDVLEGGLVIG